MQRLPQQWSVCRILFNNRAESRGTGVFALGVVKAAVELSVFPGAKDQAATAAAL